MSTLTMNAAGEIALPKNLRERYKFQSDTPIRVIETQGGVLLVPLTNEPVALALRDELAEWQSLGAASWETFDYDYPGETR